MANYVDIIIRTIDQTKNGLSKAAKETDAFKSSLKTIGTAAATAATAIALTAGAYDKLVTKTQEYDQQVLDMMISTKGTADATSRLIQVVDDAGVSYETLKTAMKLAVKNGVDPSIEGIAKLSDEYNSLSDANERGRLLMDNFGKSGLEMGRVMVLGGDALRKMANEMEGGLIVTQKAIDESEEYRKNVDQLKDSWEGFWVQQGNKIIPVINDTIQAQKDWAEAYDTVAKANKGASHRTLIYLAEIELEKTKSYEAKDAINAHADALDEVLTPAIDDNVLSLDEQAAALKEVSDRNADIISGAMDLTKEHENFTASQDEYITKMQDLQKEKEKLYPYELGKIQEIEDKQQDLRDEYDKTVEEFKAGMEEKFAMMALEKIAMSDGVAGFSEAEMKKAEAVLKTAGLWTESAASEQLAMEALSTAVATGKITAEEYGTILSKAMEDGVVSIDEVDKALGKIPKDIPVTITVTAMGDLAMLPDSITNPGGGRSRGTNANYTNDHATGGDFLIPMSYGNEGFRMGNGDTASGGERITITPKGQSGQGMGIDYSKLARSIVSAEQQAANQ